MSLKSTILSAISCNGAGQCFRREMKWQNIVIHFKKYPGSHFTSFVVLHEVSALVPIPILFLGLDYINVEIPFPPDLLHIANDKVSKILEFLKCPILEKDSQVMLHWASAYLIVKALMPLRIGLCNLYN